MFKVFILQHSQHYGEPYKLSCGLCEGQDPQFKNHLDIRLTDGQRDTVDRQTVGTDRLSYVLITSSFPHNNTPEVSIEDPGPPKTVKI